MEDLGFALYEKAKQQGWSWEEIRDNLDMPWMRLKYEVERFEDSEHYKDFKSKSKDNCWYCRKILSSEEKYYDVPVGRGTYCCLDCYAKLVEGRPKTKEITRSQ